MTKLRHRIARAIAKLLGFKEFYTTQYPTQPIWAKTHTQAELEAASLRIGQSASRLLPRWIRRIRGW